MKPNKKIAFITLLVLILSLGGLLGCAQKETVQKEAVKNPNLIMATTTSTQDTGLLDYLVPIFEQKTGYKVKVVAVGTGNALAMAEKGEADVVLVHAMKSEKPLVDKQVVVDYNLVMHNDFLIVGPTNDPAGIKGAKKAKDAFTKIADAKATFISRGDDSGTNKKELDIWKQAGIKPSGSWYLESGQGMGQTLQMASEKGAYTLTDRGTYLAQQKNIKLDGLVQGEKSLLNIYHVMAVNPAKFSKVNYDGAKAFVDFIVAPDTQKLIADFGKDKYGEPLFFADAGKTVEEIQK
ncbi:substrate-binding domain-containing protein [Brevibacillus ginsengisoli]|uniref:substrate-binding domain-containing protein n=1 Tax=Brevibacillus ginsengisoli TaxID=363854 RepID=UPI003CFAF0E0